MEKIITNYKFLDISYFYKLFGSAIKGKEISGDSFSRMVPRKKEYDLNIPAITDLAPTLNYWRYCYGVDVVYSPSKDIYICMGKIPIDKESFKMVYPQFNEKDVIYDKDTES